MLYPCLLLVFTIPLALCEIKKVYVTKTQTETKTAIVSTRIETITHWTTFTRFEDALQLSDDSITSTSTITYTYYTTLTDFSSAILSSHNIKRQLHRNTNDLIWNETIAGSAQNYANSYNCNGTLIHSGNSNYGENLALGYNTTAALEAWYNEISLYDYNNPVYGEDVGHFLQVVWKNSTHLGCGQKYCDSYYGQYTICQYWRPGNYDGEFEDNVMPLR